MRAPSSLYSNAACPSPRRVSASPTSSAACASIGCSGRNSSTRKLVRPAAPRVSAACATRPRSATSIVARRTAPASRSEEHTSELQSPCNLVCRLLLEKKKKKKKKHTFTVTQEMIKYKNHEWLSYAQVKTGYDTG